MLCFSRQFPEPADLAEFLLMEVEAEDARHQKRSFRGCRADVPCPNTDSSRRCLLCLCERVKTPPRPWREARGLSQTNRQQASLHTFSMLSLGWSQICACRPIQSSRDGVSDVGITNASVVVCQDNKSFSSFPPFIFPLGKEMTAPLGEPRLKHFPVLAARRVHL